MKITPFILASFAGQAFFAFAFHSSLLLYKIKRHSSLELGSAMTLMKIHEHISIVGPLSGLAMPPTADLRLRLPQPLDPYEGIYQVNKFGSSCPQQRLVLPPGLKPRLEKDINDIVSRLYEDVTPDSEDCLTINVITPKGATSTSEFPVLSYDGGLLVGRSVEIGQPVVFVSMNYRRLASAWERSEGSEDRQFGSSGSASRIKMGPETCLSIGGDPSKVTIWGESAGAISVALHMLVNNGNQEGLFRGAIMQSGGPVPVGDIEHGQPYYDALVKNAGCGSSSDTLTVSAKFRITGSRNCDDEGSLFSVASANLTIIQTTPRQAAPLIRGSGIYLVLLTSILSWVDWIEITLTRSGQFKRIAAIQGDITFHGPRRWLLKYQASKQDSWAFIYKRGKDIPFVGAAHGSDILNAFGDGELTDYFICFTRNLDPNCQQPIKWPKYRDGFNKLLVFQDSAAVPVTIAKDDYRVRPLEFAVNLSLRHPI
ncbi:Alpha/Beta hydrolase protein [Lactifluus volemus]|nr:Alpha/Beta hydrolase protein [Lactifluus volemus]